MYTIFVQNRSADCFQPSVRTSGMNFARTYARFDDIAHNIAAFIAIFSADERERGREREKERERSVN